MYIVNRQDLNEIFWRESEEDGWMHEDIGTIIKAYDAQLFAEKDIDKQRQVDCEFDDCELCPHHRSEEWCALAIPINKSVNNPSYRQYMEGFWEALDWCKDHYKELEKWYWDNNDYTVLLEQIITKTFAENRAPTKEEIDTFKNFWEDKET